MIEITDLYEQWFLEQTPKFQAQIEKRLSNISTHSYFGHTRALGDGLAEIKFNNGSRIYFIVDISKEKTVILLLGGNKNGQSKDIQKAKTLFNK